MFEYRQNSETSPVQRMDIPTCPSCRNGHNVLLGTKNHDVWRAMLYNMECRQEPESMGVVIEADDMVCSIIDHTRRGLRVAVLTLFSVNASADLSICQSVANQAKPQLLLCYFTSFPNGVIACTTSNLFLSLQCDWRISLLAFFIAFYN